MTYYKKIIGKKCYLSPISIEDAEQWTEWLNNLAVALPLGGEAYIPISLDKQKEWIHEYIKGNDHVYNIVDLQRDQLVGRCMLFDRDSINRTAKVGLFIGDPDSWDKGYGSESLSLLLDLGFNLLNLHNIMLGTFSFNERAQACYKKIGFKEIGRRREARMIAGKKYDVVLMDLLADEFESVYVKKILESI